MQLARAQVISAYRERFARGDIRESPRFYSWVWQHLPLSDEARVLDIACGAGGALAAAEHRFRHTYGIDFTPLALQHAAQRAPRSLLACADGEALPYASQSFDAATLIGSLEHFPTPLTGLLEARRVVRQHGLLAVFVPNSYYVVDVLWQVWRTGQPPSHNQPIERFATVQEWKQLIEQSGLTVTTVHAYNFLWPHTLDDWRWYLAFPRKLLNLAVAPLVPFNLSYSFLYLCRNN